MRTAILQIQLYVIALLKGRQSRKVGRFEWHMMAQDQGNSIWVISCFICSELIKADNGVIKADNSGTIVSH